MPIHSLSSEDWEKIFDQSPIGIVFVSPDYRWVKVNQTICSLLEFSETELLSKKVQDVTHPEDLQADLTMSEKVAKGEVPGFQMVKRFLTKRGFCIWVRMTVWGVFDDESGKFQHFIRHIQPLLNGEKAKVEATGKSVNIRNVFTVTDFIVDNWKTFLIGLWTFITAAISIGVIFWSTVGKVDEMVERQKRQEEIIQRLIENGKISSAVRLGDEGKGS